VEEVEAQVVEVVQVEGVQEEVQVEAHLVQQVAVSLVT